MVKKQIKNDKKKSKDDNLRKKCKHLVLKYTLEGNFLEEYNSLSFAAVISATDAVPALTFIHEDSEPKLFSILFGEGVVNDAVCIVIYKILTDFQKSGGQFSVSSVIGMFIGSRMMKKHFEPAGVA